MEHLIEIALGAVATICGGVFIHLLADDLHLNAPHIARRIIEFAARQLPQADRNRFEEEWLAHLWECEGFFATTRHALECAIVAHNIARLCKARKNGELTRVLISIGEGAPVDLGVPGALEFLHILREAKSCPAGTKLSEADKKEMVERALRRAEEGGSVGRIYKILHELEAEGSDAKQENVGASGSRSIFLKVQLVDRFGRVLPKDFDQRR